MGPVNLVSLLNNLLNCHYVGLGEVVTGADHFEVDSCFGSSKSFGKLMGLFRGADGVGFPTVDLNESVV